MHDMTGEPYTVLTHRDGRVSSMGPRWGPLRSARDPRAHATHLTDPPCPGASLTHGTSPPRGPPRGGDTRGGGGKGASARAPPFWPMPQGGKRAKSRPRSYPHRVLPPLPGPSQGTLEKNPPPRAGSFQEGLEFHPCRGSTDLGPDLEKTHTACAPRGATNGLPWARAGSGRESHCHNSTPKATSIGYQRRQGEGWNASKPPRPAQQ